MFTDYYEILEISASRQLGNDRTGRSWISKPVASVRNNDLPLRESKWKGESVGSPIHPQRWTGCRCRNAVGI